NQSSLKDALPFTVDRMHYLLDGLTIATDVNGDNCKDSDPSSNGSDLRTVYDSTKQYTVTEHVFALYTQENKNCAISYRVYRSLDAKFWTLNVNLKEKKGLSAIVDVGSLKETDCQTIAIDDNPVQKLLAKELKASFIKNKMQPETQEKY